MPEPRYLAEPLRDLAFGGRKMAFVSGPRQAGKTTLGRLLLAERATGRYATWDDVATRRLWATDPKLLAPPQSPDRPLLVLDEIHKARQWKRGLKGLWDVLGGGLDLLVTGSARLNVYRRGSDSLMGRYFHFRLHPFSAAEVHHADAPGADDAVKAIRARSRTTTRADREALEALTRFGGFPEPLLGAGDRRARLWRRNRVDQVIREDLRDLSRLPELSAVQMLAALLPERVASPLSLASLQRILEVRHDTVSRWMGWLRELYYVFEIRPWHRRVARSLKKEGKTYLFDWAEVGEPAARFENLVACHLLKAADFWTDTGDGDFALHYLRDKQKRELDFLIVRDRVPWLAVEAKLGDSSPSPSFRTFLPSLGAPLAVQIVATPGHWTWHDVGSGRVLVASADEVLPYLV